MSSTKMSDLIASAGVFKTPLEEYYIQMKLRSMSRQIENSSGPERIKELNIFCKKLQDRKAALMKDPEYVKAEKEFGQALMQKKIILNNPTPQQEGYNKILQEKNRIDSAFMPLNLTSGRAAEKLQSKKDVINEYEGKFKQYIKESNENGIKIVDQNMLSRIKQKNKKFEI